MATSTLEQCIFVSFHTRKNQYPVLLRSLERLGMEEPMETLAGIHEDSEGIFSIFAIPVEKSVKDSLAMLRSIFLKTSNYYPSISEKPSEVYQEAADMMRMTYQPHQRATKETQTVADEVHKKVLSEMTTEANAQAILV